MFTIHKICSTGTLALILLASLILSGCQSTATYYQGYKADNKSISPLSNPAAQGTWETFDINLTYQYDQTNDIMNISGIVNFALYHEINISHIRNMDLYLFFLDKDAMVLETVQLAKAQYASPDDQLSFTKSLAIPANSKSFAFGYRGAAHGDGGGGGMSLDGDGGGGMEFFSDLPKRPKS